MDKALYDQINAIEDRHWWYIGRRKIIFDQVLRLLQRYEAPRILDIGCGTGYNLAYLQQHGYTDAVGLDLTFNALQYCRQRQLPQLICGDAARPPLAPRSFDVILALDLVEHVEDDTGMLRHLAGLLKPGGRLVIFTPAFQFLWGLQDEVSHHFRRYTAGELRHKISTAGLALERLTYSNTLLFPAIAAARLLIRLRGGEKHTVSENDLHPAWSNGLLTAIFCAEQPLLRVLNFPVGVSLLAIARRPD
ncbi:MAG: methyltransferase domain-containing protein [Anaerolineae bacterium]|jgi:SAM-dependent methyltransferase|nr:methyltransferase domain-containing protein [Anaerolineae bacterium]